MIGNYITIRPDGTIVIQSERLTILSVKTSEGRCIEIYNNMLKEDSKPFQIESIKINDLKYGDVFLLKKEFQNFKKLNQICIFTGEKSDGDYSYICINKYGDTKNDFIYNDFICDNKHNEDFIRIL